MSGGIRAYARHLVQRAVQAAPGVTLADAFAVVGGLFDPPLSPRLVREVYSGGPYAGVETAQRIAAHEAAVLHLELAHIDARLRAWEVEKVRVRCRLEQVGKALCDADEKLECPGAGAGGGSPSASSCAASHPLPPPRRASSPGSRGERTALHAGSPSGRTASRAKPIPAGSW